MRFHKYVRRKSIPRLFSSFFGGITHRLRPNDPGSGEARGRRGRAIIDILPDDVFLDIFDFYVDEAHDVEGWQTLVHVCQRWRHIVFASPHRLRLQLLSTSRRSMRDMLGVWPALPIVISSRRDPELVSKGSDSTVAALMHRVVCPTSTSGASQVRY
ncbi:hypothetical protein BC826DRAFT_527891 [Russula brevipes]|nr:hypothetical protein BC826DRAFT_527891 [Russula brevipes]